MVSEAFIRGLPKAELHLHIEGTLEPEMMFELAARNGVDLPFDSVADIRGAYEFDDLQSFLDIYYQGAAVLQTEQDFYDLMWAYLEHANQDGVRRAEIFFDPQTHTRRDIGFPVFMAGFLRAIADAEAEWGISAALILCFLRDLPGEAAVDTWEQAADYHDAVVAVGLDSSEVGNPPEPFAEAYALARAAGARSVAHAGEEGPPEYITGALDALGAERIDHGVRCEDDHALVERLVEEGIPLTICPLSNLKLGVFERLQDHNLKRLLNRGVKVTINSDDPSYFGGYIGDNYVAVAEALNLDQWDLVRLARNSIEATFLGPAVKERLITELETYVASLDQ
ncbi:MAG: adenosine deaminase [Acidobacteria bacterium]|nr:adenosine deaminase [Acidobacteriota bacterium]MCH8129009.1 adenosine deaminase [Acidobacteriota bacterium]MCH8990446.1 adenosine deaminase [Acidobacteriota bacterium]